MTNNICTCNREDFAWKYVICLHSLAAMTSLFCLTGRHMVDAGCRKEINKKHLYSTTLLFCMIYLKVGGHGQGQCWPSWCHIKVLNQWKPHTVAIKAALCKWWKYACLFCFGFYGTLTMYKSYSTKDTSDSGN